MVELKQVLDQFHLLGVKPSRWAKAEIKELSVILVPGENLTNIVFGWYDNGFALLCCTDQRVLLIDKKPLFLKMEDLRYDKISEVRFLSRLLDSTVELSYVGTKLVFKSWEQPALRKLVVYVQETIMRINQQHMAGNVDSKNLPAAPVNPWPNLETSNNAMSYELLPYAQDSTDISVASLFGVGKNPYTPTTRFMRRRVPFYGMTGK